jgi:F-type H+-transporting ATPase subunit delta
MIQQKIALRYAKALFRIETAQKKQECYRTMLLELGAALTSNPLFRQFIFSPDITLEEKKKAIRKALSSYVDDTLWPFLSLLLDKQRFSLIASIAFCYDKLVRNSLSEIAVTVISAEELSSSQRKRIINKLTKFYGKTIILTEEMDPTIIGGVIILAGHDMWDWSVRSRLEKMKEDLLSIAV